MMLHACVLLSLCLVISAAPLPSKPVDANETAVNTTEDGTAAPAGFDYSKFTGGKGGKTGGAAPFDFKKFMGGGAPAGGAPAKGPGGAFDYSKFTGGKGSTGGDVANATNATEGGGKGPGGGFDFSKYTGGKAAGKGPGGGFDFSKFMGGGTDAGTGPGGGFDFSKFMGGKGKTGGADAKGPGGGFDFSKFMGGGSPGGAGGAGGKQAGGASSNAAYLKSIGMGGADKTEGAAAKPGAAFDDAMDHLKKLKALLDAGVISQADFDLKKGEVLEKI